MQKGVALEIDEIDPAKIKTAVREHDIAIRRILREMRRDQREIEKLKTETRAMLAELKSA
jgi:hypothetical protein